MRQWRVAQPKNEPCCWHHIIFSWINHFLICQALNEAVTVMHLLSWPKYKHEACFYFSSAWFPSRHYYRRHHIYFIMELLVNLLLLYNFYTEGSRLFDFSKSGRRFLFWIPLYYFSIILEIILFCRFMFSVSINWCIIWRKPAQATFKNFFLLKNECW